jgi:alpha-tubulin suppressor-like RCC1 family protein
MMTRGIVLAGLLISLVACLPEAKLDVSSSEYLGERIISLSTRPEVNRGGIGIATVKLNHAWNRDVSFLLETSTLDGLAGRDFEAISRRYTIPAWSTEINIPLVTHDTDLDPLEPTVQVKISEPANASLLEGEVEAEIKIEKYAQLPAMNNVGKVAVGAFHSCASIPGKAMMCWGNGVQGQLGFDLPVATYVSDPGIAPVPANPIQIQANSNSTCALYASEELICWGEFAGVQSLYGAGSGVTHVALGFDHRCIIQSGDVLCTGDNSYGQDTDYTGPELAVKVAAGMYVTCTLLDTDELYCWGRNDYGQLGDGTTGGFSATPVQPSGMDSGVSDVSVGTNRVCAIKSGQVYCWGSNFGTTPTLIPSAEVFTRVEAYLSHFCALSDQDELWCWGHNEDGLLGRGDYTPTATSATMVQVPLTNVSEFSVGQDHTCAIADPGRQLYCWGSNDDWKLGTQPTSNAYKPMAPDVLDISQKVKDFWISTFHLISAGCLVLVDGQARCWGEDEYGSLGRDPVTPILVDYADETVSGLELANVSLIRSAGAFTCAFYSLAGVESLGCWGASNISGSSSWPLPWNSPVNYNGVPGPGKSIGIGFAHYCMVGADEKVYCWGQSGDYGQAGQCITTPMLPVAVSGISGVQAVALGHDHSCALVRGGAVKCWGSNTLNQLGDPNTNSLCNPKPKTVPLPEPAKAIAAGWNFTCAVLVSGVPYCWGANDQGQLGRGTTSVFGPNPSLVTGLDLGVKDIAAGRSHACATMNDGSMRCWGRNNEMQLGILIEDPAEPYSALPVRVPDIWTGVKALRLADNTSCAIIEDGSVRCWGLNDNGVLHRSSFQVNAPRPVVARKLPN